MFVVSFLIVGPATALYAVRFVVSVFSTANDSVAVVEFFGDMPMVLMAFYAGAVGSGVSYIYGRNELGIESDATITKMAKLLFGGLIGVAAFVFLGSSAFMKFFYPKFNTNDEVLKVSYQSIIASSFLAGLTGRAIVRAVQKKAGTLTSGTSLKKTVRSKGEVETD